MGWDSAVVATQEIEATSVAGGADVKVAAGRPVAAVTTDG
jgi:hypothetical protein